MKIITAPNPILRQGTKPLKKVDPQVLKTVDQMITLTESFSDPEGVGLAAPQIGIPQRFFIAKFGKTFQVFFNPKITHSSKETKVNLEGCLSIPNYYGDVARPKSITVSYQDKTGKTVKKTFTGAKAMIFQHEYDHLEGNLFIDHVLRQKRKLFKVVGKDKAGADIFEEVNLSL